MSYGQYSANGPAERRNPLVKPATSKGKRVKQVYSDNSEIAHLWAHKAQSSARNPRGNFYFNGDTIYSYGSHFPIARIVTVERGPNKGQEAILFTTRGYSSTTSGHIREVRSAVYRWDKSKSKKVVYGPGPDDFYMDSGEMVEAGRRVFTCYDPRLDVSRQLAYWDAAIIESFRALAEAPKGTRATTKAKLFHAACARVSDANAFAEYFGERKRWKLPESAENMRAAIAEIDRANEAQAKRDAAKRARETAKRERERQARYDTIRRVVVPRWIAGGGDRLEVELGGGVIGELPEAYLRTVPYSVNPLHVPENLEVETSHGARFPLSHAVKAMRLIRKLRADFAERHPYANASEVTTPLYKRNGHTIHLGHYALDEVTADGTIKAGCHVVTAAEFDRFAALIEGMEVPEQA
jgi:hypothetical protein